MGKLGVHWNASEDTRCRAQTPATLRGSMICVLRALAPEPAGRVGLCRRSDVSNSSQNVWCCEIEVKSVQRWQQVGLPPSPSYQLASFLGARRRCSATLPSKTDPGSDQPHPGAPSTDLLTPSSDGQPEPGTWRAPPNLRTAVNNRILGKGKRRLM